MATVKLGGSFSYIIENDKIFRAALERARAEVKDLTVPLKNIARDFYKSQKAIFQLKSEGQYPDLGGFDPGREVWPGGPTRREHYKAQKKRKYGFVYPLLKATGRLEKSLTDGDSGEAVNQIVNKDTLYLGTEVPYGIFHQSDEPRSKIPLRKFLFIGPEASQFAKGPLAGRPERWLNIMNDYVLMKMGVPREGRGPGTNP